MLRTGSVEPALDAIWLACSSPWGGPRRTVLVFADEEPQSASSLTVDLVHAFCAALGVEVHVWTERLYAERVLNAPTWQPMVTHELPGPGVGVGAVGWLVRPLDVLAQTVCP